MEREHARLTEAVWGKCIPLSNQTHTKQTRSFFFIFCSVYIAVIYRRTPGWDFVLSRETNPGSVSPSLRDFSLRAHLTHLRGKCHKTHTHTHTHTQANTNMCLNCFFFAFSPKPCSSSPLYFFPPLFSRALCLWTINVAVRGGVWGKAGCNPRCPSKNKLCQ